MSNYIDLTNLEEWLRKRVNFTAVYLLGSRVLPWITHPGDTDIGVFLNIIDENIKQMVCNIHYEFRHTDHDPNLYISFFDISNPIQAFTTTSYYNLYAYQWHFAKLLFGTPLEISFDIYGSNFQFTLLQTMQQMINSKLSYHIKGIYHVYTNLAMWHNGNYQLTNDDIIIINRLHDQQYCDQDYQLIKSMLQKRLIALGGN